LGLELAAPRPGDIATCANKCVFCFIHQLPRGMRKSLYVKDDDFRLSFLHGNYITLSDLDEASFERIIHQRLSPLYISVHATDPELRHALLGRPRHSAETLPRLERLAKAGIGSRFVFLADEIYLLAGLPLPSASAYEGFPIAEDGIGLVRRFEDGFARAVARGRGSIPAGAMTVVTGQMFAPRLVAQLTHA